MSAYFIQKETLASIGDAIREKTGETALISPVDMPEIIEDITTGLPNGTEWTCASLDIAYNGNALIYYCNGMWFASSTSSVSDLVYSKDGINWQYTNLMNKGITSIKYINGLFFAGTTDSGLLCSSDGITWENLINTGHLTLSAYVSGVYVVNGRTKLYYSTDGLTWVESLTPSGTCYGIEYLNGILFARTSTTFYTSTDGISWTQGTVTTGIVNSAAYLSNMWVMQCAQGYFYSEDGTTWTKGTLNVPGRISRPLECIDGVWVTGVSCGISYSTDGITWTQSNVTNGTVQKFTRANGLWVAGTDTGIYYSTDGITWTQSNIATGTYNNIENACGIWIAASERAGVYYSTDGMTWTACNGLDGAKIYSVKYNDCIWVAICDKGIYYSVTWKPSNT